MPPAPHTGAHRTASRAPARHWRDWLPAPMAGDGRERLRAAAGALLGILAAGLLSQLLAAPVQA